MPDKDIYGLPISVGFSLAGAGTYAGEWKTVDGTFGQLLEMMDESPVGPKDGRAVLQGRPIDGVRKAKAMHSCCLMMFDLDTGHSIDPIISNLEKDNTYAYVYETFSSGSTNSTILRDMIVKYYKEVSVETVKKYLIEKKHYNPEVLDTCSINKEYQDSNGMQVEVVHSPIKKYRIVLILKDSFVFSEQGGMHSEAIKLWKGLYDAVALYLGIKYDTSCTDPSRLMYLPTRPDMNSEREIFDIGHSPIDLSKFDPTVSGSTKNLSRNIITNDGINLNQWLKAGGMYYQAADVIREYSPDVISRDVDHDKIDVECPWMGNHSGQSRMGFFVTNAGEEGEFTAYCAHHSCVAENRCRLTYLKALIDTGVIPPESLADSDFFAETEEAPINWVELSKICNIHVETDDDMFESLNEDSSTQDVLDVLTEVAKMPLAIDRNKSMKNIKKQTKISLGALAMQLDEIMNPVIAEESGEDDLDLTVPSVPKNINKYNGPIYTAWGFQDIIKIATSQFLRKQAKDPKLFVTGDGQIVRMSFNLGVTLTPMKVDGWQAEIQEHCKFLEIKNKQFKTASVPKPLVAHFNGSDSIDLPVLDRIVAVPVYDSEGNLHVTNGYNPDTKCYLHTDDEFNEVPDNPTDEEVEEAKYLFNSWVLSNFPFSDQFTGEEIHTIALHDLDKEGHRLRNPERGKSSYAHVMAMILQPFVKNIIEGPTPMYFIDKSAPGSGAGYLASVPSFIATGELPSPQVVSQSEEELSKAITSSIKQRNEIIFLDNVNHKMDSPSLASALTSGIWSGRDLGKTQMLRLAVHNLWLIAGNNVSFSDELMRRNVPIRIDANTPRPAEDRLPSSYKIKNFQNWLKNNRPLMVEACHVMINNWISQDMPLFTGVPLQSFEDWSDVMGGILEANGIEGFLENRENYLGAKNEDDSQDNSFVQRIFESFGVGTSFTAKEVFDDCFNQMTKTFEFDLPIDIREAGGSINLGRYISRSLVGATYDLTNGKTSNHYKLVSYKNYSPKRYKIILAQREDVQ